MTGDSWCGSTTMLWLFCFTHSSDGYLGYFFLESLMNLAAMNLAAMNFLEQVIFGTYVFIYD
jgi:hypothetical protein